MKERVKEIWKHHKKEIFIGGAIVVGGAALAILVGEKVSDYLIPTKLDLPESVVMVGVGEISSTNFNEYADIQLCMTSLRDLGDFGKALIDAYGWDPDSTLTGILSTGFVCGD